MPLWEMETDYYLHNRHIEASKGMKAFQESFGVLGWDGTEIEALTGRAGRVQSAGGIVSPEQSLKIQNVRDRCSSQNKALSNWWKVAVQRNVQQRMVREKESRFYFAIIDFLIRRI